MVLWSIAVLLVALTIVEEIVVGLVHHQPMMQSLAKFFGDALPEKLAGCLVMVLVLLPLVATIELRRAMGTTAFASLLKELSGVMRDVPSDWAPMPAPARTVEPAAGVVPRTIAA